MKSAVPEGLKIPVSLVRFREWAPEKAAVSAVARVAPSTPRTPCNGGWVQAGCKALVVAFFLTLAACGGEVVEEPAPEPDAGQDAGPTGFACWRYLSCSCVDGRATAAPVPPTCKGNVAQAFCETYQPCPPTADAGRD